MQASSKPKGLAKIWREIKRPFRPKKIMTVDPVVETVEELCRKQGGNQYISYFDLSQDIRNTLHKIPSDIDLVVGIPKSGIIPAMMIGLSLINQMRSGGNL